MYTSAITSMALLSIALLLIISAYLNNLPTSPPTRQAETTAAQPRIYSR
jgi:hypothetical protein